MNLLTIGNSFTDSLNRYLVKVAESAGLEVFLERANFGGCELARHWSYIQAEEQSELCRIYFGGKKLKQRLLETNFEVITIQQASHDSWRSETFEPFATYIIDYIRKYSPQSEIMIQQTWAYRNDHPQFLTESEWNISQEIMYEKLTENYRKLALRHNLQIIPSGFAVQKSRELSDVKFTNYPPELIKQLHWPDLPPQAGDVVGKCEWIKSNGKLTLHRDLIHLNVRGEYLQACVWVMKLFHKKAADIKFIPPELDDDDAKFLKTTAEKAVLTF